MTSHRTQLEPATRTIRIPIGARRPGVAGLLAVSMALALSGCQYTSTIQTDRPYTPADGFQTDIGALKLRNVLVVAGAEGGAGTLVGTAVNSSDAEITAQITTDGAAKAISVKIPAGQAVNLTGTDSARNTLSSVKAIPGGLVTLQISVPATGVSDFAVPVQYPLEPYASLAPSGFTPTPEPPKETAAAEGH